jgi:hypothetical protein
MKLRNSYLIQNKKINQKNENFFIFLDLASFRATWDIIAFLILARIKATNKETHIIIIPDINEITEINPAKEKGALEKNAKKIRVDNIIKPTLELIEGFNPKITFLNNRNELDNYINVDPEYKFPNYAHPGEIIKWYPPQKEINKLFLNEKKFYSVKADIHYKELLNEYIKINNIKKKIITITLRQSSFNKSKNSSMDDWIKLYYYLESANYFPIILDDFENLCINKKNHKLNSLNKYEYANIDLRMRLALYEKSYLNISVNNGPVSLLVYSRRCNYIIFKHFVDDPESSSSLENNIKTNGLQFGEQYPFATKKQKIIWSQNDNFEYLKEEVNKHLINLD